MNDEGHLSDEDLAPAESTWATQNPIVPQVDAEKCLKIVQVLQAKHAGRRAESIQVWKELQNEARERFLKIGINAHVEIAVHVKDVLGNERMLEQATAERQDGWVVYEGSIMVPPHTEPLGIYPRIIFDDYETIGKKQDKAVEAVAEREKRRQRGDSYKPENDIPGN